MLHSRLSRRSFSRWAAASPLLLGMSGRSWASWDNVETPPVFATIKPAAVKPVAPRAELFAPGKVRLLESPFLQAQRLNASYINRLDTDRLLHNFRVNAGLPSSARPLGGS